LLVKANDIYIQIVVSAVYQYRARCRRLLERLGYEVYTIDSERFFEAAREEGGERAFVWGLMEEIGVDGRDDGGMNA